MRKINNDFIYELKQGTLKNVLKAVKADETLCLEIRDSYINIYYRGGNIIEIKQNGNNYIPKFNEKYCIDNNGLFTTFNVKKLNTIEDYVENIPFLKREMDNWLSVNHKPEREFQQLILRDNNFSTIANDTDYYIADIEYANNDNKSRFDMIGIKWISTATERKNNSTSLAIIEVKYGDNAITGESGIVEHFKDIDSFIASNKIKDLCSEAESQFNQKVELGLIKGMNKQITVDSFKKPEFIIACANHKPSKSALKRELMEALKICPNILNNIDIKIATANLMGYGLYIENMIDLSDYLDK